MNKYATSAEAVANFFIDKKDASINNLKLQKLVYISFGWYSVFNENAFLFENKIEAWQYGPVIPSLYHQFKVYGKDKIEKKAVIYNETEEQLVKPTVEGKLEKDILQQVYDLYSKKYSAKELVDMTHAKLTPWTNVYDSFQKDIEIPKKTIQAHYKELYKSRNTKV